MLKNLRKSKKGFTLIELIVVIAILAILAIVAIPRLAGFTTSAKISANQNSLTTLQNVCQIYEADTGSAPANLAALQVDKYLGTGVTPAGPKIVTDANYGAAAGNTFIFDTTTKKVTIGNAGANQFAISAAATN